MLNSRPGCSSFVVLIASLLACCGGWGGSSGNTNPPPRSLSYPAPRALVVNQAITALSPTVSGSVSSYTISPTLAAGLSITAATGVIPGTPTAVTSKAAYTVTAGNSYDSTTAVVSMVVNDIRLQFLFEP